jgi:hypothetical protein
MKLNNPFEILSVKLLGVGLTVDYSVTGPKTKLVRSIGVAIEVAVWSKKWQFPF